jgi:transcriptional regulator with XRE-family HTH domain
MMDCYALTDSAIAELLGQRLRALRLHKNRTQGKLAERTALSVGTIQALESGRGKIENLIAVLRDLNALDGLDAFLPEPRESPLALAKASLKTKRARARASGGRAGKDNSSSRKKESDSW